MKKSILIVAPHPDDETLGCGGLIARRVREGASVSVLVLTMDEKLFSVCLGILEDPSPQEVCRLRREETRKAVAILGMDPANVLFWDFPDAELEKQRDDAIHRLAALLKQERPDEIYCTSAYEEHSDHRAAASIVADACATVKLNIAIRHYFVGLSRNLSMDEVITRVPVVRVDVSEFVSLKKRAVDAFDCHLKIISPRQKAPLFRSLDKHVHEEELFINCGTA